MKVKTCLLLPFTLCLLASCTATSPNFSTDVATAYPSAMPSMAPSGLAALLTGQVISSEEQQLRDIQTRQILLDFPIKVGVIYYGLQTRLEEPDQKAVFDTLAQQLKDSGLVKEAINIPQGLISSDASIDALRKLGARFQCDLLVIVSGNHSFGPTKSQNLSFFDSFTDKATFESQVKLDAITLDVFTGTLLSPFDAAVKGDSLLLDRADKAFSDKAYAYQKTTEIKAWDQLRTEALASLTQLKQDVLKRQAEIAAQPTPTPSSTPTPTPSPTATPSPEAAGVQ